MQSGSRRFRSAPWMVCIGVATLAACAGPARRDAGVGTQATRPSAAAPAASGARRGGGYYLDDGPGGVPPVDPLAVPDAQPLREPLNPRANRPYVVFGRQYTPLTELAPYRERGPGSWYGRKFHGQRTSNGDVYDMYAMTAAHPTLPLPSYARVTNVANGRSVLVRVNDRGPFLHDRVIDLSWTAASKLGYVDVGTAELEVELVTRFDAPPDATLAKAGAAATTAPATAPTASVAAAAADGSASGDTAPIGAPAIAKDDGASPNGVVVAPVVAAVPTGASAPSAASLPAQASAPPPASTTGGVPRGVLVSASVEERLAVDTTVNLGPAADPAPVSARTGTPPLVPPTSVAPTARVAATPAAAAARAPASPSARDAGLWLQLGAFGTRENAEAARARMSRMLESIGAPLSVRPDGAMYKVQAGPYARRDDAQAAAERVRQAVGFRPFTVAR